MLVPEFRAHKREIEPNIILRVEEHIARGEGEAYNEIFTFRELVVALNKKKSTAPGGRHDTLWYVKECV